MKEKITINWASPVSIKRAEKKKARLENEGYVLIHSTVTGIDTATLEYVKINK